MKWCTERCTLQLYRTSLSCHVRHGAKVGPGPRDPRPWNPPQSLKVGPGTTLKFKSGAPGSPSKFKSGITGPPSKFKSGTPSPVFNEFVFLRIFHRFFYSSIFASF